MKIEIIKLIAIIINVLAFTYLMFSICNCKKDYDRALVDAHRIYNRKTDELEDEIIQLKCLVFDAFFEGQLNPDKTVNLMRVYKEEDKYVYKVEYLNDGSI